MPSVKFLDPDIATWIRQREIPERTDGPHVSRVLASMLRTMNPAKYGKYGTAVDGQREGAFELGYTWEDTLANALRSRLMLSPDHFLMEPTEIARDGIYGTPDRVIYDCAADRWILEELKLTWYSCRDMESDPGAILNNVKFTYWLLQVKTYAAMLLHHVPPPRIRGARLTAPMFPPYQIVPASGPTLAQGPIARIRAFFLNGTYKYGDGDRAKPLCWEIEWRPIELEEWWAAVVRHVAKMQEAKTEIPNE